MSELELRQCGVYTEEISICLPPPYASSVSGLSCECLGASGWLQAERLYYNSLKVETGL